MAVSRKQAKLLMDALREVSWQGASARRRSRETVPGVSGGYAGIFLATLSRLGVARLSELAEALQVDNSVASRHVAALIEAGHVERAADPSDGRAQQLRLTEAGRAATRTMRDVQTEWLREALQGWDDERALLVTEALTELAQFMITAHEQLNGSAAGKERLT